MACVLRTSDLKRSIGLDAWNFRSLYQHVSKSTQEDELLFFSLKWLHSGWCRRPLVLTTFLNFTCRTSGQYNILMNSRWKTQSMSSYCNKNDFIDLKHVINPICSMRCVCIWHGCWMTVFAAAKWEPSSCRQRWKSTYHPISTRYDLTKKMKN